MQRLTAPFRWFANTSLARSLRFRLIGIVLLATLPTIALLFLTASQQRDDALEAGQEEAEQLARLAANDQGREMDRIQRELFLLSRLPEVQGDDPSACTSFFQTLVADQESAIYVDLRVIEPDGEVICRSSVMSPVGDDLHERDFVEAAFEGATFTVGPYSIHPVDGRSLVSFASPVRDADGDIDRAIIATLDLGRQSTYMTGATLPEGAVFSVVSENGTLLLQRPVQNDVRAGDQVIGTPAVDTVVAHDAEAPDPADDSMVIEDDNVLSAAAPVVISNTDFVETDAWVIVELPEASIVQRADDAFRENLGRLGVAVLVVILAAWVSADLFVARDSETRKSIVAELYHGYSSGAVEHLDGIIAPDFVDHSPAPGQAKGIDGIKQNIAAFRTAFPDGEVVPREMLAERDKVIARVSLTGTHVGEFQGLAPSGKRMIADGMETFQFRDGVIAESWSLFGPLVEMKKLETPERERRPQPRKPTLVSRIAGRFRRDQGRNEA